MKIGLLPLYVKLYDDKLPDLRVRMDAFYEKIAKKFENKGFTVIRSEFCRIAEEFKKTVHNFEENQVDAIVTVHIAYSPSLESVDALSGTHLPVIVLDTTETYEFTNNQDPAEIMYCHGVHGVMDMCSMLTRKGKPYAIAAGHLDYSDCIDKACGFVRAAVAAKSVSLARVGLIGGEFDGMGDIQMPYKELEDRFGIKVTAYTGEQMKYYSSLITDEEIENEKRLNSQKYDLDDGIIDEEYNESIRSCLATRKCIKENSLTAFSVNFSNMGESSGLSSMPFIEACKEMENGIGYAGEGDTMNAAFLGAFLKGYPETTFVEIFCPDWKNNMVFFSHMGEMNYRIAAIKPCIKRVGVNYSPGEYPYVGYTRMRSGKGVYVNISRGKEDYKMVISSGEIVDCEKDNFGDSMRGWMKLSTDCANFLEQYSIHGATHHSIFIYGADISEMELFGRMLGLETIVIK